MARRGTTLLALSAIMALVGAACSPAPGVTAVTVTATTSAEGDTQTFGFDAPTEFVGGRVDVTLVNEGGAEHEAQILALSEEKTAEELVPILTGITQGAPIPDYLGFGGGVNVVPADASSTAGLILGAGSYAFACFIDNHFARGMLTPFTVTGDDDGAELPATDGSVTAFDYGFTIEGVTAGTNTVTFSNDGDEPHFAAVLNFPDATLEEVEAEVQAFLAEEEGQLGEPEEVGGLAAVEPDGSFTADLTLESGQVYVFLCFLTDREGGQPHFVKGMVETVEIA